MAWFKDEWYEFHQLKESASEWELECAVKILQMELADRVEARSRAAILSTYFEDYDGDVDR